jgi:nitrogen fixation protein FixH
MSKPRPITGWTVLAAMVAFFTVVVVVNLVMVRFALTTFGGLEVESSYKAGLAFSRETADARAQDARNWKVDARILPRGEGALIEVAALDSAARPLAGFEVSAKLVHPTDRRRDRVVPLREDIPGIYRGNTEGQPGRWDLVIEIAKDRARLFRSKSRVQLR